METIFMNSENSETNEPHRFKLDLTDKLNLKNPNKTWLYPSQNTTIINLKFLLHLGMILLIYLMVLILLQTFRTLNLSLKNKNLTENPPVQIYPNKIKNRIVFKIKTGYKLELLTPETMKLLGSTKKDVDKDKDGDIVPKLESVEVFLVHCNLVK